MLYIIIQGALFVQCLTIGTFFLIEKKHQKSNLYLAAYLFLKGLNSAINLYSVINQTTHFAPLNHIIGTFFGPTLLLFAIHQFNDPRALNHKLKWLMLTPSAYVALCHWTFFKQENQLYQIDLPIDVSFTFFLVFGILYINKSIETSQKMSALRVRWLRFIFFVSLFQVWSYYTNVLLIALQLIESSVFFGWSLAILDLILVSALVFISMKFPELTSGVSTLKERVKKYPEEKYKYSSLTDKNAQNIIGEVKTLIEELNGYKNPELSLTDVASETGYEAKLISQAVNQYLNLSFKQYLNEKRLEAAQRMLSSEAFSGLRINEIMYESGFNSKSVFNSLFKKKTGHTPKEYRSKY